MPAVPTRPSAPASATGPWSGALDGVSAPTAVIDLAALRANSADLVERAGGVPIRLASKSIRVRGLIQQLLKEDGYAGVLAYSAAEARWLVQHGVRDVVVAYPTVDVETVRAVSNDPLAAAEIAFMVDQPDHLRLLADAAAAHPVRVCLDIDCSLRIGPVSIGAHRSSIHTPDQAERMARLAQSLPRLRVAGLMFYDAQIAGVPDSSVAIRAMKRMSLRELPARRAAVTQAVRRHTALDFVNAGGTGSLHLMRDDAVITDLAAGSGLFTPTLFDHYDGTRLRPAAYFMSPVVRKPAPEIAVTFSGGYLASGPASKSREPVVAYPQGLRPFGQEGYGEVQSPLHGQAARALEVGDLVWFRHAKAGEMCERFNEVVLLDGGEVAGRLPTYRGEGQNFG